MKLRALLLFILCVLSSAAISAAGSFSVKGRVVDGSGAGIANVVVNNGVLFTTTDANGNWLLSTDTLVSKFISISTPAAYRLPSSGGLATGFYVPVRDAVRQKSCDFVLEKRETPADNFYYIAISDPQMLNASDMRRWNTEFIPDMRHVVDSLSRIHEVVGVVLGDMVFDALPLLGSYASSYRDMDITMFHCIGNHDFDKRYKGLNNSPRGASAYGEMAYGAMFGPTDYSFNIGKAHVITMKNINYKGNKSYVEMLTPSQLAWLANDLKYVPKGSLVILNVHAAGWNREDAAYNMRDAAALQRALYGYNVHVFCGHTHSFQNIEVAKGLYQHNLGAACGSWWDGNSNRCGTPNGYMVVDVSGSKVSWKYKSTGMPFSYQMKVYGQGKFKTQPGYIVANIWDYDPSCRVEWYQDGRSMGSMERFADFDSGFVQSGCGKGYEARTSHLFRCRPFGSYSEVKVVFTNRFGIRFSSVVRSRFPAFGS